MTNLPATASAPQMNTALSLLMDVQKFDHLQRVGRMLAVSPLFPEHLRKGGEAAAVANGALVLNMAYRLNEDPLTVAQNIYFVGGKPGWNTSYCIAKANQAGVFRDPIDWEIKGKGDSLTVTAFGILARTGKRVEVTLDWQTAVKEGWTKNAKYQSIPEQMFRYRTAAFLIRLYCPEVMIGLPAQIEQELEIRDITPEFEPDIIQRDEPSIEAKATTVDNSAKDKADADAQAKASAKEAERAKASAYANKRMSEADEAKQKAEAVAATEKMQAAQAQDDEPQKDSTLSGHQPDEEQFRGLLEMMLADLADSGPEQTEEIYSAQIDQMKQSAPGCYREWQDALTEARTAA